MMIAMLESYVSSELERGKPRLARLENTCQDLESGKRPATIASEGSLLSAFALKNGHS